MDLEQKNTQSQVITTWLFLSLLGTSLEPVLVKFFQPDISALGLMVLKSLVGGILMIPLYGKIKNFSKKDFPALFEVSLFAFITNTLLFVALDYIPATVLITIITMTPLIVGLINHFRGTVEITIKFLLAFSAVMIGIAFTLNSITNDINDWKSTGILIAFVSVMTSAYYRVRMDLLTQKLEPIQISAALFSINGLIALAFTPYVEIKESVLPLGMWLGFAGVMANIAFLYAIKHLGSTRVSVLAVIQRPLAVILGFVFLKEKLSYFQILGMLFIFTGIYYAKPKNVQKNIIKTI